MWTFSQAFRTYLRSSSRRLSSGGGFTLIELMVSTAIIVLITTVLLFRHGQFNSTTLLRSLSYSIALSVRQAQLYGVSVREFGGGFTAQSHGVQFLEGSPTTYFLFADTNNDGGRASNGSEDVDSFKLQNGYQISDFCVRRSSPSPALDRCQTDGTIDTLAIVFIRPNPDAQFRTGLSETYSSACIELTSPAGSTRKVDVTTTGQISVSGSGSSCP